MSQDLFKVLEARDTAGALTLLAEHPEAAHHLGPDRQSAILVALYGQMPEVARRIAELTVPDVADAAALGDVVNLELLLDKGDSLQALSFDGWTPLRLSGFMGQLPTAQLLIARGAQLNMLSKNAMANTPLCASIAGAANADVVRLLLAQGADVRLAGANGVTPLHLAASRGAQTLVEALLEHGADPRSQMSDGSTPADIAAARGHEATAAMLRSRADGLG